MTAPETPETAPPAPPEAPTPADRETRLEHIAALRALGIDPYPPARFAPTLAIAEALSRQNALIPAAERLTLAGRLIGLRTMGKVMFADLLEDGERLQLYLSQGDLGDGLWQVVNLLDLGDLIGVEGTLFVTRRGETSLKVERLTVLCKPVAAIPLGKRDADGRFHQALADAGRLLRDRHVALIVEPELRRRMVARDRILRAVRAYFHAEGFIEVETPVLSEAYGGAAAKPFVTRSEALDVPFFLRVSPELALKRLLVGGLQRVFEIGKNFRNEGIDATHNPEFTALEWYEAWSDYEHQMERFETMVARLAVAATGGHVVDFKGRPLDFTPPWPRLRVLDAVAGALGTGTEALTEERLRQEWKGRALEGPVPRSWGELVMAFFEELVEPTLWAPTFVIDHPLEVSPLTKRHRADPRLVERFEPFAGGMEIGNAYSELNDPQEQRQRLEAQDLARDDPYGLDEPFLRAIEDGMPQAGGAGLGIDRIVMLLTGGTRLSDVILFPAG